MRKNPLSGIGFGVQQLENRSIDEILEVDRKARRKQRHTAHRIWMRLRRELPAVEVAESTVRSYVRQRKVATGLAGHEIFVPQSYEFAVPRRCVQAENRGKVRSLPLGLPAACSNELS